VSDGAAERCYRPDAVSNAFFKYEGLGNDFILVEASDDRAVTPERAMLLCQRHFGIGADGLILVLPSRTPECAVRMRVINADGTVPEMCGNGARCVALHFARSRGMTQTALVVDTDAGGRACAVDDARGEGMVTVDMGTVRVLGDRTLSLDGREIRVTAADAGNPHAVLLGAFPRAEIDLLGSRIAVHSDFPKGTNVEFASIARDGIDLVVWERGVGVTLACGTGGCATAAVACAKGLVRRGEPVAVRLPGGTLEVTIDTGSRASMRGPARFVFSGMTSR
jgi:diaminopimelate epimerase